MPQEALLAVRRLRGRAADAVLALAIVAVALVPRLDALDVFITPDEYRWVCRSIAFHRALSAGDLAGTLQTGHPGVLTMWLGVPAMGVDPLQDWLAPCETAPHPEAVLRSSSAMPMRMAALLYAGRRGFALLTAAVMGLAFLGLVRLLGRYAAVLATLLMVGDPFYLAHSRLVHLDASSASLLFLSLLGMILAIREERPALWALAGAMAGLATANKSPSLVVLPFGMLVIGLAWLKQKRSWRWALGTSLVYLTCAVAAFVLIWPAMWVKPVQTLVHVLGTALGYASEPHSQGNFFWGEPLRDPGVLFYPVALGFRLPPWTMLGAALSLLWLRRRHPLRVVLATFWGFIITYVLFMTFGEKKFDRYLLPVFLPMQVVAAAGFVATGQGVISRWRGLWKRALLGTVGIAGALVLGGAVLLLNRPYYLTYYSPLLGGGRAAVNALLVGWGEGLDLAASFLNQLPNIEGQSLVSRMPAVLASFFQGQSLSTDEYDIATTDYVLLYINEVQRELDPLLLEQYYRAKDPLYVAQLRGMDYAWVYANDSYRAPTAYIEAQALPGRDAIVISRPSLVAKHYAGPLPVTILNTQEDRTAVLDTLEDAASQADRLWYVRYPDDDARPQLAWIDHQWRTHAFLLDEQTFGDIYLALWQSRGTGGFRDGTPVARPIDLVFGDDLRLMSLALNEPVIQWRRGLGVTLGWEALRDLDRHRAISIRVVDAGGRVWGQGDSWIEDESLLPTAQWEKGHIATHRVAVWLHPGTPPGAYALQATVYDKDSGQVLPVQGGDGESGGGIPLGPIDVVSSPIQPDTSQFPMQERRNLVLAPGIELLGWTIEQQRVRFDETMSVCLYWRAGDQPRADYGVRLQVLAPDGRAWADGTFPLASSAYPTSHWAVGEVIWRPYDLPIRSEAPATRAGTVLTLVDEDGRTVAGPLTLSDLYIEGHYYQVPPISHPTGARLGDGLSLLGFDLESGQVEAGGELALTLYWQATEPVAGQYKVFVHLLDQAGARWGQKDAVPLDGRYPTDRWRDDEVVVDRYIIPVSADAPAGQYRLAVGMYDEKSGDRLRLVDAAGDAQPDNRLLLDMIVTVMREP